MQAICNEHDMRPKQVCLCIAGYASAWAICIVFFYLVLNRPIVQGTPRWLMGHLHVQVGGRTGVEGPGLSRWQRGLWGLGTVLMQYAWSRLDQVAAAQHWGDFDSSPGVQRAWKVLRSCETALNLASLLNFLVFLQQGKYRYVFAL